MITSTRRGRGDLDHPLAELFLGSRAGPGPVDAERDVVLGIVVTEHGDPGLRHPHGLPFMHGHAGGLHLLAR